jgi:hypothetical protein
MGKPLPLTLLGVMNPCHLRDDRGMARPDDSTDTRPTCGGSLLYRSQGEFVRINVFNGITEQDGED